MDAVRVCDGKRETAYLKQFFLFLLANVRGSYTGARRAAKTWIPELSDAVLASFWSPTRPCELPFGASRTIFESRSPISVFSHRPISGRQPVFRERFVSNARLGNALRGDWSKRFMETAYLGLFRVPACSMSSDRSIKASSGPMTGYPSLILVR